MSRPIGPTSDQVGRPRQRLRGVNLTQKLIQMRCLELVLCFFANSPILWKFEGQTSGGELVWIALRTKLRITIEYKIHLLTLWKKNEKKILGSKVLENRCKRRPKFNGICSLKVMPVAGVPNIKLCVTSAHSITWPTCDKQHALLLLLYARTTRIFVAAECYSRETCRGATGEGTHQWLETAENYGGDWGVENSATFRSNVTTLFLKRRLREIFTDVRTLYE